MTRTVTDVALDRGRAPLTVTLKQGRPVRLEVRTEDGELFGEARVHARLEDGSNPTIHHSGIGHYDLADLPDGTLHFEFKHAGREYTLDHDTTEPVARMTLPDAGRIEWTGPVSIRDEDSLEARILSVDGELEREVYPWIAEGKVREKPTWILPGTYAVELKLSVDEVASAYVPPFEIEVLPGETTRVDLSR